MRTSIRISMAFVVCLISYSGYRSLAQGTPYFGCGQYVNGCEGSGGCIDSTGVCPDPNRTIFKSFTIAFQVGTCELNVEKSCDFLEVSASCYTMHFTDPIWGCAAPLSCYETDYVFGCHEEGGPIEF